MNNLLGGFENSKGNPVDSVGRGLLRGLAKKAAHVFMNNMVKQFAALLLGVFIARYYGAEGRGVYYLLTAGASILGVFLSLGLNNSAIYHIKHGKISVARGLIAVLVNSLIVAFVTALLLILMQDEVGALLFKNVQFTPTYLAFVAGYIPVVLMTLFLVSYYMANHETGKHRFLVAGAPIVTLVSIVLLATTTGSGVDTALLVLLLVESSFAIYFSLDILRYAPPSPAARLPMASIYSYGLRGYPGSLGNTILTQVDAIVVAAFGSPALVGYYSVSKSVYRLLLSIPQALNGLLFGTFCDMGPEEAGRFNLKVVRMMIVVLALCILPALLLGGPFILFVYGKEFAPAVPAFKILLFAALFMGVSSSFIPLFLARGRPGLMSGISVAAGLVSVTLTIILVPRFSIEGAAAATLAGSVCFMVLRAYHGRKLISEGAGDLQEVAATIRRAG